MKIIFFGSSEFAVPALQALVANGYSLVAVVTVPDQPMGREHILTPPPIKQADEKLGVPVLQPASLADDAFFETFKSLHADLAVVAAYGKIIPERYLEVPKYGFLNIHPSLLPLYRGPTPIQGAIMNGDSETGVTIMVVDPGIDHGPILASIKYQVLGIKYYKEIHDDLAKMGAKLLIETIPKYISGEIKPVRQDHDRATFTKIFSRIQGHIDWTKPAVEVANMIRALNPEPGTWTIWKSAIMNIKMAAISKSEIRNSKEEAGTIVKENGVVGVVCGDGNTVEIVKLQFEGRKEMSALEFCNGHPDLIGSKFE